MDEQVTSPDSLRDALEASFEQAEQGTLQPVVGDPVPESTDSGRVRDEQGKFAKTDQVYKNPSPVATTHDVPLTPDEPLQRPTTWKKEYLPLWDKLQSGQPLTQEESVKFLKYTNQRETEYKTGVSTYKSEADNSRAFADNARALQEAIAPFIPDLQANGIHPAAWINNLGRAHQILVKGSEQQRLDAFVKLAQDYNVPLQYLLGGQQPDQNQMMQLDQIRQLEDKINNLTSWTENEKTTRLQSMIDKVQNDVDNFPHFEAVRGTMAQLLESGLAPTLEAAYAKAIRMQDDVWQIEQERLLTHAKQEASKTQQVAKAKAAAVSLKSATPSGQGVSSGAKDRRSALADAFESVAEGRV